MQVRDGFEALSGRPWPTAAVRSQTQGDEGTSEVYLLTDEERLSVWSRGARGGFRGWHARWDELCGVELVGERDGLRLLLSTAHAERSWSIHLDDARAVEEALESRGRAAAAGPAAEVTLAPPSPSARPAHRAAAVETPGPPLLVQFAGALQALLHLDGGPDEREEAALQRVVADPEAVARGLDWWREVGTDGLIARLAATLTGPQRLCLMTNLLELAMADGVLRSKEQILLKRVRDALGIDAEAYQTIFDVLLWKNRLSVFREG